MGTHNFRTFFASAAVTAMVLSVPVSAKAKKGSITKVAVTNLPAKTLTLKKGKKKTLKFKVTKKGKISKALAYKSSNKKVVTVSKKGVVKAKKKGKATVTAYAKANKKKKVAIKIIVGTPVTKIKLNKTKATLKVKKTLKLKATVTPKKASYKKVIWKTSNKKIATVSSAGKVTAKKKGTAKITATAADGSGKKATAKITVKAAAKKKTPAPAPVPNTVATLQVTNPRTVTFTLSQAQALDANAIKLESKTTEEANYRHTLKVKSMTTIDNIHYTVNLKKGHAIPNNAADHNVRLTVTGLANNSASVSFETLFRKGKINKTYTTTMMVKRGERLDFTASKYEDEADTYETSALPAGLKQDPNSNGVELFGTPTETKDTDITVKETDVYGNTYTKVTHLKFYDKDNVNAYVTYTDDSIDSSSDAGYYVPTVNHNGTYDTLADDSLNKVSVHASVNVYGGQAYQNSVSHYDSGDEIEDVPYISTKYGFVGGDTSGLKLDDDGDITGEITSSRTVTVRVTKKNTNGHEIYVDVPVTFNVADATLVKGTITDNNGAGVQDAYVSAVNTDLNTNYESSYDTTNSNGQYDYVLVKGANYDVTVSRDQCDNFYASQAVADTMNYKLDGYQYNVRVDDQREYKTYVDHEYIDEATNERYFLNDNYNYYTGAHNATIFTDKPSLTLTATYDNDYYTDTDYTGTLTIANGAANVTITKK